MIGDIIVAPNNLGQGGIYKAKRELDPESRPRQQRILKPLFSTHKKGLKRTEVTISSDKIQWFGKHGVVM